MRIRTKLRRRYRYRIGGSGRKRARLMAVHAGLRASRRPFSVYWSWKNTPTKQILKRYEYTSAISNITSTAQVININAIAQGTGTLAARTERKIKALSWKFKGLISWDQGGTPANIVRFIVADVRDTFTGAGITYDENIYDKNLHSDIGHVWKDFRMIRREATIIQEHVRMRVHPKRHYYYDGDGSTDFRPYGFNRLVLIVVSDGAAATTDVNGILGVFRYYG